MVLAQLFVLDYKKLRGIHLISTSGCYSFVYDEVPHIFLPPIGRTFPELVIPFLTYTLVGHLDISQHLCTCSGDDTRINVGTRSKIVEYTSCDSSFDEGQAFLELRITKHLEKKIWSKFTSMLGFQPLSKIAMAARLPEPMVT